MTDQVETEVNILLFMAPDLGTTFEYENRTYVVTGWVRPMREHDHVASPGLDELLQDILEQHQPRFGPKQERMVFCTRKEATFVVGTGVSSILAPIGSIRITGKSKWDDRIRDYHANVAKSLIGEPIM